MNSEIDNNHEDNINDENLNEEFRDLNDTFGSNGDLESEALEARIMLDGAMVDTGAEVGEEAAQNSEITADEDDESASEKLISAIAPIKRNEVLFVDSAVEGYQEIIANIDPSIEVHILDSGSDGVEQMASVLSNHQDLDAIHIISHGRSGTLDLGSTKLTAASMAGRHADEMAIIRSSLSEKADILIYGCNFAAGSRGSTAVAALMSATGADVAASDDLTGAEALNADWDLEVQQGELETTALAAENWDGVLIDTDGDGVDDAVDIDDDNDGILDTAESPIDTSLDIEWGFFNPSARYSANITDSSVIASGTDFTDGPGLTSTLFTNDSVLVSGLGGANLAAAIAANDYHQVTFTTQGTLPSTEVALQTFYYILHPTSTNAYQIAVQISDDGFATSHTVAQDLAADIVPNFEARTIDLGGGFLLNPSTTYTVRFYLYGAPSDTAQVVFDNPTFGTTSRIDTDGDGISDQRDIDSDNDGITDNIEAQTTAGYIAPNADSAATYTANSGLNSAYVATNGLTPVNTDGSDPLGTGAITDAIADFRDTDSDGDGVNDTVEVFLFGTPVGASTPANDADGDGLFDVFDGQNGTSGNDGYNVNEGFTAGAAVYPDTDGDQAGATPLTADVNFRDFNLAPTANNDSPVNVAQGAPIDIDVVANDTDPNTGIGDVLSVSGVYDPAAPGVLIPLSSGGSTTFADGTVVELLATGQLRVTPPATSSGYYAFQYQLRDASGLTDTATASLNVLVDTDGDGVADRVDIDDDNDGILDTAETPIDSTYDIGWGFHQAGDRYGPNFGDMSVIASGTDFVDGPGLSSTLHNNDSVLVTGLGGANLTDAIAADDYHQVTFTTQGTLPSNEVALQTFIYLLDPASTNAYKIAVQISDDGFATRHTLAQDLAADIVPSHFQHTIDLVLTGNVTANDSDLDGDSISVSAVTNGDGSAIALDTDTTLVDGSGNTLGTLNIAATGAFTFTPAANYNGPASFGYTLSDGNGGSDTATASITVNPVNDAPQVQDPATPGVEAPDATVPNQTHADSSDLTGANGINFGQYFFDLDTGDSLTFTVTGLPTGLSADTAGVVTGTIASSASQGGPTSNGIWPVTITANDGNGGTKTVTVNWTVTNPAPVATDDAFSTDEDVVLTGSVLANDSDADGDTISLSEVRNGDGSDHRIGWHVHLYPNNQLQWSGRLCLHIE